MEGPGTGIWSTTAMGGGGYDGTELTEGGGPANVTPEDWGGG